MEGYYKRIFEQRSSATGRQKAVMTRRVMVFDAGTKIVSNSRQAESRNDSTSDGFGCAPKSLKETSARSGVHQNKGDLPGNLSNPVTASRGE